jgi:hypothetical protein
MPLGEPQEREVGQLLLVALAYLTLADPDADRAIRLSETKGALASATTCGAKTPMAD